MLREHQIQHLLEECERVTGRSLDGIRGQLRSELHVRSAVWELIVLDAAAEIGRVEYERKTPLGRTPDVYVETSEGASWIEAAFLLPRFGNVESRREAFLRAMRAEERRAGVSAGTIGYEFYGHPKPYGFEIVLPQIHDLAAFFRGRDLQAFFAFVTSNPSQSVMIDLAPFGATVRLGYVVGQKAHGGSTVVMEQPRTVQEHAVYRVCSDN